LYEFADNLFSRLRRMSTMQAAIPALPRVGQGPQWADFFTQYLAKRLNFLRPQLAALSPK
jgi:hypothetical protein